MKWVLFIVWSILALFIASNIHNESMIYFIGWLSGCIGIAILNDN